MSLILGWFVNAVLGDGAHAQSTYLAVSAVVEFTLFIQKVIWHFDAFAWHSLQYLIAIVAIISIVVNIFDTVNFVLLHGINSLAAGLAFMCWDPLYAKIEFFLRGSSNSAGFVPAWALSELLGIQLSVLDVSLIQNQQLLLLVAFIRVRFGLRRRRICALGGGLSIVANQHLRARWIRGKRWKVVVVHYHFWQFSPLMTNFQFLIRGVLRESPLTQRRYSRTMFIGALTLQRLLSGVQNPIRMNIQIVIKQCASLFFIFQKQLFLILN